MHVLSLSKDIVHSIRLLCATLVLLLCGIQSVFGQRPHDYDGDNSITRLLSSGRVTAIIQDRKGFLWIGTDDGLNRYDGNSVVVYKNDPDDTTTIRENFIRCITVDQEGNLWIGHDNGKISIYDQSLGHFKSIHSLERGLAADAVSKIFFDKKGQIWIAVVRNGLFRYENNLFHKVSDLTDIDPAYKRIPRDYRNYNSIYDIYDDGKGMLWLATHDGLYQLDQQTNKLKSVREKKVIPFSWRYDLFHKILAANDGLWMVSWGGGLTFYNLKTHQWKNYKPRPDQESSSIYNIMQGLEMKEKDQLWIASMDYGLGYFDITKEKFVFYNTQRCQGLFKDKTGLLWTTSDIDGITKVDPINSLSFVKINVPKSKVGEYYLISAFYHDLENKALYFGVSYGDGLHVYNETTGKEKVFGFETLEATDRMMVISSIYKDKAGILWVLTRDFIYYFDEQRQELKKFKMPYSTKNIRHEISAEFNNMLRARNGDLWISSSNNGLYQFDQTKNTFVNYTHSNNEDSLCGNIPDEIIEDNSGRIWILTEKGLSIYNYNKKCFKNYFTSKTRSEKVYLQDITKTPDGDIWIASNEGIYQYSHLSDSIHFKHWTHKDGLPASKILSAKSDSKGGIWIMTSTALFYLNPADKSVFTSLIAPKFVHTSAFYIDNKDDLYLGNVGGYNYYEGDTQFKTTPPSVVFTSFKVNNNEFLHGELKRQKLKYYQNSIMIEFAALDFRDPAKIKYSYILEGLDTTWTTRANQPLVNYENLPTGNFTFKVKAANPEGIWSKPIEVQIYIAPPFWGTWYFKVGIVVCALCWTYIFYRWRITKVRDEEKLKSHFSKRLLEMEMRSLRAQMNPHFIFNSLNSINKFIVMADPETASFYLTKFSRLIRLILENSRQAKISLEQDLTALTHYIELELLRFDHHFSYLIDIDPAIDTTSTRIPPLIIQPYVENSIWHGFVKKDLHGKLTIRVSKESDHMLLISIEDNGVGRGYRKNALSSNNSASSRGLQLTEDRLKMHSQESNGISSVDIIDLKNEDGEATGTKVILRLATQVISKNYSKIN